MKIRKANAIWMGDLKSGNGEVQFGDKQTRMKYSFASRFEEGDGTNPEELIGAALSGCHAMALAHALAQKGYKSIRVDNTAAVYLDKTDEGFGITKIVLTVEAEINGVSEDEFQQIATDVAKACPIAKALKAVSIDVEAKLK
jgi:osmotically inducible protein OsmC